MEGEIYLEKQRLAEETARNERRFDAYNMRRVAAKLPPLKWADYVARKHRLPALMAECNQLVSQKQPEHRDNVFLLNR